MNKLLMTAAIVGVAFVATPAKAEVELGLGGHFKGYVTWNDQDEDPDVGVGDSAEANSFDILRETEVHFTGETVLDNGLTVGFHAEAEADGGDGFEVEESYAYFAGNWGRVNFGAEDGAGYLLQVAAPAADSNVDGIRQYINPISYALAPDADGAAVFNFQTLGNVWDYAMDATLASDKITYITPVFNGFQAAGSYTPDVEDFNGGFANSFGVRQDDAEDEHGDAWELAARYEGQFNAVRLAFGGGWQHVNLEEETTVPAVNDDLTAWNLGTNLGFGPFNVGAAYVDSDQGLEGNNDDETWVLGADYTTGPFVIGASYYNRDTEQGAAADDLETDRYSGGVTYTYGPGMTFRGSVHHVEHEVGADDMDATSFLLGTQIGF